jgi:ubiquinone/menaquinone biosynthesis C-methylase UbiE
MENDPKIGRQMTRWQQFYLEEPRISAVPASNFAKKAPDLFTRNHKRKILDLACGVGRDSFFLAEHSLRVTAGDLASSGIEIARQTQAKFAKRLVDFIQVDARYLPFGKDVFEGVYCFGLLHEFTEPDGWLDISRVMEEIYRVLEPGGILLLAVVSGDPQEGLPHNLLFNEEMFDSATQAFVVIKKEMINDLGCTGREDYHTWQGMFRKDS